VKKIFLFFIGIGALSQCVIFSAHAASPSAISIAPVTIIQGDPAMVTITSDSSPTKLLFDGTAFPIFTYNGASHALIPIGIHAKVGTHEIKVTFANEKTVTGTLIVNERKKIQAPLGIPAELGGNTPAAAKALVTNLATANTSLENIRTGTHAFWTKPFVSPLATLAVTDPYGYNRETGEYTIAHKGTDFHAPIGTKVMAMNRGVVRIARTFGVYGKTIVIDHGFGLQTLYMHLSKIYVYEGELVLPGEAIGLSGMTGDALGPHLHISVKINGVSIDPMTFFSFFNIK
jgi:murein DD-endopeptidase MepM/ murein hydrolase activator NlpD